eukprot:Tbor_TRINITY_DN4423_c0_g1::TRINITY_DN4423_c0_g1_i1::g.7897::m.7897
MHTSDEEINTPTIIGNFKVYRINGILFEVPLKYKVLKALGMGTYGLACSALDCETNTKIAIKKCSNIFRDVEDGKRILREIGMMRFLNHKNLLSIIDILPPIKGDQFEEIYIVTQLFDVDMSMVLKSNQVLLEEHIKFFLYQILCGLLYLHSSNVAHRDLKPANIVTSIKCELKIIDFGLSRSVDPPNNDLTDYVITRWYRPPELLLGNTNYDTAVDIWSAGCIFAELFRRKPLFEGRNTIDQVQLILNAVGVPPMEVIETVEARERVASMKRIPTTLSELVPTLTNKDGLDILTKMLTPDPAERPTAAELLLHPYLSDYHDPNDQIIAEERFQWVYEGARVDRVKLMEGFWNEIVIFNPHLGELPRGIDM